MLRIHFLRHGQTECSCRNVYCGGECDVPLNPTGLKTAQAIAKNLAAIPWRAIISSPQLRAFQTVKPLAEKLKQTITQYSNLREALYGDWNGKTPAAISQTQPELYSRWLLDPVSIAPPRGETALQVLKRAQEAIDDIVAQMPTGNILIAAHKTVIRILLSNFVGIDIKDYRRRLAQPLGCLSVVSFHQSGPRLDSLADVSHLPKELWHLESS